MRKQQPKSQIEELIMAADIAHRYYDGNQQQAMIAAELKISQSEVSRYLTLARDRNMVHTTIDPYSRGDDLAQLEVSLRDTFTHLRDVVIAPIVRVMKKEDLFLKELGKECAKYVLGEQPHGKKFGVSGGSGIHAFIEGINSLKEEDGAELPYLCNVYPLLTLLTSEILPITPIAHVADLVRLLPQSRGTAFQLPPPADEDNRIPLATYTEEQDIHKLFDEIQHLDYYIVGIGSVDYQRRSLRTPTSMPTHQFNSLIRKFGLTEKLQEYGAVGQAVYQPFDQDGTLILDSEHESYSEIKHVFRAFMEQILWLPLRDLHGFINEERKTGELAPTIIGLGGGVPKHEAIRAALKAEIFNVLITDPVTAEYLLDSK